MSLERAIERFTELLELAPNERERALREGGDSEEVQRLVREMLAGEVRPLAELDRSPASRLEAAIPERVGSFEVVRVLGEGGMGVVYEARQDTPRRSVALKMLRSGFVTPELLARFRDEAEVLGWLDHPGIARVFGAGTADLFGSEVPYIAMELVDGVRVDDHIARTQPSITARLELIADLAETVHHAHLKGVVHRDLKPANVLITADGSIKVLDFGIARITEGDLSAATDHTRHTRTGELLGTLPYMSPEQVSADPSRVDVRSDVYSLGVMAYELLAGRRPLDVSTASLPEALRAITEDEPTRLGLVDPRLAGDVELVVGKALAKRSDRRYSSADGFARDLRRIVANEPVRAHPPSRAYRVARFTRRHRGLVVGLCCAGVILIAGTGLATTQYLGKLELLERRAEEAETAERAIAFLEEILDQADPYTGEELTVREVSRLAAGRIQGQFEGRPEIRARMLLMLGTAQKNLGLGDEARSLLEEALALREEHFGTESREYAQALATLGLVRNSSGDSQVALREQRRAVEILRTFGPSPLLAESLSELGSTLLDLGALDEAREVQTEALAMNIELRGKHHPETLSIRHNIGIRLLLEGEPEQGEQVLRELLEEVPKDARTRPTTMQLLAYNLRMQGRSAEAEPLLREAVDRAEALYGRDAALTRISLKLLGNVLADLGQAREAIELQREVRDLEHRRFGPSSSWGVHATHDLAFALHDRSNLREAEELYLEAIDGFRDLGAGSEGYVFQAQHNLAMLYWEFGDLAQAEELERESLEGRIELFGEGDPVTLYSWRGLGDILVKQGRVGEAIEVRREIVRLCEGTHGPASVHTQNVRLGLVELLVGEDEFDEALELLEDCEAALPEMVEPAEFPRRVAREFAELFEAWGLPDHAARWRSEEATR